MSSFRSRIVRAVSSAYVNRVDVEDIDIPGVRRLWNGLGRLLVPAFGVDIAKTEVGGLYAEWLTPKERMSGKVLLYLHGGAYVVGGCDMHRQMVSHLARAGHIRTLLPEYRLAPEHKFPAAVDDAVMAYRHLIETGTRPEDIIVGGDSAGGGLSVALLLALRDAGDALPAAAVLLSPFLDATGSGESMRTRADQDPWFQASDVPVIADHYCERHQRRFPLVSPVYADIEGLPPMFIQVGDDEILLSDSERLANECAAKGIDVELEVWPGMWHVFQMFVGKMPESRQAINKMGAFIQARFN
jgi:acetyl esterase/lipase